MVKGILAGLQWLASVQVMPRQERILAADDSGIGQRGSDVTRRRTLFKLHQLLFRRPGRHKQPVRQQHARQHQQHHNSS